MKKILAIIVAACMTTASITVFANYTEYFESPTYAELSDKVGGNDIIGAFVDYRDLVDRHINKLVNMNSAERQQLVTDILTDAGEIYVGEESVDFTDGDLAQYCFYAAANVAEAKSYLKHYGISSIADVPLTVNFGSKSASSVTIYKSFLATAYNSGISDILIKSNGVGVALDIEELSGKTDKSKITISLTRYNVFDFVPEYKDVAKSDTVYQFLLSDGSSITSSMPGSKIYFYDAADDDRVYHIANSESGPVNKSVSTSFDGEVLSFDVNNIRWFGIYKEDGIWRQHFADVPLEHWAYEYIGYLAENGIASGSDNGRFNPDDNVTREEFVKMLVTALSLNDVTAQCSFDDVSVGDWYYGAVASAYEKGIAAGTDVNLFGVGENISRQDLAVMMVRALEYKQIPLEVMVPVFRDFNDGESVLDYARDAVMTMRLAGFISGDEDNFFNPYAPATRAEVAKIIYMVIDYIERI